MGHQFTNYWHVLERYISILSASENNATISGKLWTDIPNLPTSDILTDQVYWNVISVFIAALWSYKFMLPHFLN